MKAREVEKDERAYEEMLNDCYGTVTICGIEFEQGTALKELDPIAFRCGLSDEPVQYECSECSTVFDDEDEAEDCCAD